MAVVPASSHGGGTTPDLAAVLTEGNDADGNGIDNLTDSTMSGGSWIFDGANEEYPRGKGAEAAETGGAAPSLFFEPQASNNGGATSLRGGDGQAAGKSGGVATIAGGAAFDGSEGAFFRAGGGEPATTGLVGLRTGGLLGASGQSLVSDGNSQLVYGGVRVAAAAPVAAPAGVLPFAYDTTAVTGGFYFWNGAAWVKVAAIL